MINNGKKPELSEEQIKRLIEAKKSFQELKNELAPFKKKQASRHISSIAEWRNTSDIIYGL